MLCFVPGKYGLYKPRTGRTGQCMNHAPAVLAAPAVYCIHGRIIHQAKYCQTVQNVNEKYTPPHRLPQQTCIDRRTAQLLIKAGARFIHWPVRPVRGLYRPYSPSTKQNKSDRNSSSAQCYDGASTIHDNHVPYNKHILQISSLHKFCPGFTNNNFYLLWLDMYSFLILFCC